jgi:hypothetical protein
MGAYKGRLVIDWRKRRKLVGGKVHRHISGLRRVSVLAGSLLLRRSTTIDCKLSTCTSLWAKDLA